MKEILRSRVNTGHGFEKLKAGAGWPRVTVVFVSS